MGTFKKAGNCKREGSGEKERGSGEKRQSGEKRHYGEKSNIFGEKVKNAGEIVINHQSWLAAKLSSTSFYTFWLQISFLLFNFIIRNTSHLVIKDLQLWLSG